MKRFLLLFVCFPFVALGAAEIHWLKNDQIEAGFTWKDGIRLSVLKVPGGAGLLRETDDPYHGLKTWLMFPSEILALRALLSEEPASMEVISTNSIRMLSSGKNDLGLQLEWIVTIHPEKPEIQVLHRIHNLRDIPVQAGIWTIATLASDTTVEIPFSRSSSIPGNFPNDLAVFPFTRLPDTRIRTTEESFFLDIRSGSDSSALKFGLVQREGLLFVDTAGHRIEFKVPYDPAALYPEGGSNTTVFTTPADSKTIMGEAEQLGPLQLIEAEDFIEFPQTIRVVEKP